MGFLDRVAYGMCAAVPSFVLTHSLRAVGYLSEKCKLSNVFYKTLLSNFEDAKSQELMARINSSICPYKTMGHAVQTNGLHPATFVKSVALSVLTTGSLIETLLFRCVLQELLLRQLPAKILQKVKPGSETLVDCPTAKVARVLISSAICFALTRRFMQPSTRLALQSSSCEKTYQASFAINTLVSSVLKETPLGLVGSMAHSLAYTAISMPNVLFDC